MVQDGIVAISFIHCDKVQPYLLARNPEYTAGMPTAIASTTLAMLACPVCKQQGLTAIADQGQKWILCAHCQLRYPIVDGIPVMLAARASR